ncbi:hypothetical protein KQ240_04785 [Staphylococcus haemolyticus]|uniref:hypothetical protein n=1 Tax=Staphylococcus haemolyticus TaxID=1283 RepID=UPI001C5D9CC2|nr:hypothetical protein [Staphylococcus haemolyticus]MBW4892882.1 hypothetical protein [Staphylococcus haemolyticus]
MTQTYERNEGGLSDEEYMQLIRIRAAHERALRNERRQQRINHRIRSEQLLKEHRVSSKWFRYLVENDIFPKVRR